MLGQQGVGQLAQVKMEVSLRSLRQQSEGHRRDEVLVTVKGRSSGQDWTGVGVGGYDLETNVSVSLHRDGGDRIACLRDLEVDRILGTAVLGRMGTH